MASAPDPRTCSWTAELSVAINTKVNRHMPSWSSACRSLHFQLQIMMQLLSSNSLTHVQSHMEGLIRIHKLLFCLLFIFYDFLFKLHLCGLMYMNMCAHARVYICLWREARDSKEGIYFLFVLFCFVLFFN